MVDVGAEGTWGGMGDTEGFGESSSSSSIGQKWAGGVAKSCGDVEVPIVRIPPICRKGRIKRSF